MSTVNTATPLKWKWDKWQQDFIDHEGSVTARKGRQVGCSMAASKRISKQMQKYVGTKRLIIAPSDRQSSELFLKTQGWLGKKNDELIKKAGGYKPNFKYSVKKNMEERRRFEFLHGIYNELPTKETIVLKKDFYKPPGRNNVGSICYSLPAGRTGVYLRTYALDFLDADEAAYIPEQVYIAVKPMLAISEKEKGLGWETLLSSTFGKGGFFYDSFEDPDYKQFHISSEDCPRIGKEFLRKQRAKLTKAQYMQEWLGEFIDEWNQYFKTKLIKKCMGFMEWSLKKDKIAGSRLYLGVDFARMGGDETAFVIAELFRNKIKIVKVIIAYQDNIDNPTLDTIGRIEEIDRLYGFKKIFVDSGGLGAPMMDILRAKVGRKVIGLDNATKRIQVQGEEKKKGILKEDLYTNTLLLMETGKIEFINDLSLLKSLKSITYEYGQSHTSRQIKIYGTYSHITEALVRAAWCIKEKGLDLYIF